MTSVALENTVSGSSSFVSNMFVLIYMLNLKHINLVKSFVSANISFKISLWISGDKIRWSRKQARGLAHWVWLYPCKWGVVFFILV